MNFRCGLFDGYEITLRTLLIFLPSIVFVLLLIWIIQYNEPQRNQVIILTLVGAIISGGAGLILGLIKAKRNYLKYELLFNDEELSIQNEKNNENIKFSDINNITEDLYGNILLYSNYTKVLSIPKYISEREEILKKLRERFEITKEIKKKNTFSYIIKFLPYIFFIAYQVGRFFPNIYYYIITGILFVLSAIVSFLYTFKYYYKSKMFYINIIFYGFILYMVLKNVIHLIAILINNT